ncbi:MULTISPECIES: hypothetical protein [Aquimarina]|uniref:Inclusion body protein n=1 Tax=Aquimarina algiphila TaxID=2047982 RepID=A0A554VQL7_9FLAO|nr:MULTISPECIES: hypothetical protein [Aquimarina]TSE10819.1 hypothetical protein FOF46_02970 [Aquimarina algiphila]
METSTENLTDTIITFNVHYETLEEVITNLELGMGTMYKPIPIDGLVLKSFLGIPNIEPNTDIKIYLQTNTESNTESKATITYCKIQNVGKVFTIETQKSQTKSLNPWNIIFSFTTEDEEAGKFRTTPDGSLYVSPNPRMSDLVEITTQSEDVLPEGLTYISYSIIFSLFIESKGQSYYFRIDPLAKVSSNRPQK